MGERRRYSLQLVVNGRLVNEVIIDPHYEERHPEITDALILELVKSLDGGFYQPSDVDGEWQYFTLDRIEREGKQYRLVWCMEDQSLFIGVINCFRR